MMGSDLLSRDEAPRGAIIALGPRCLRLLPVREALWVVGEINPPKAADVFPLVRVAVSSQRRADAEVVENALEKIRRPRTIGCRRNSREGGADDSEAASASLHLDQVLRDLRRAVGVEVVVGEPIVLPGRRRAAAHAAEVVVPPPWSRELEEDGEEEDVVVEVDAMDELVGKALRAVRPY